MTVDEKLDLILSEMSDVKTNVKALTDYCLETKSQTSVSPGITESVAKLEMEFKILKAQFNALQEKFLKRE